MIVTVEGLDGVYVGPSDLSLSMGKTPTLDPQDPEVLAAIKAICAGTRKCGKIAGVWNMVGVQRGLPEAYRIEFTPAGLRAFHL